jgi:hypothetical protein
MEEPPPSPQEVITETQSARQRLRETVEKSKERCPTELKFTSMLSSEKLFISGK